MKIWHALMALPVLLLAVSTSRADKAPPIFPAGGEPGDGLLTTIAGSAMAAAIAFAGVGLVRYFRKSDQQ